MECVHLHGCCRDNENVSMQPNTRGLTLQLVAMHAQTTNHGLRHELPWTAGTG